MQRRGGGGGGEAAGRAGPHTDVDAVVVPVAARHALVDVGVDASHDDGLAASRDCNGIDGCGFVGASDRVQQQQVVFFSAERWVVRVAKSKWRRGG